MRISANDNRPDIRPNRAHALQHLFAVVAPQGQIRHHQRVCGGIGFKVTKSFFRRGEGLRPIARPLQIALQKIAQGPLVLDDQEAGASHVAGDRSYQRDNGITPGLKENPMAAR